MMGMEEEKYHGSSVGALSVVLTYLELSRSIAMQNYASQGGQALCDRSREQIASKCSGALCASSLD